MEEFINDDKDLIGLGMLLEKLDTYVRNGGVIEFTSNKEKEDIVSMFYKFCNEYMSGIESKKLTLHDSLVPDLGVIEFRGKKLEVKNTNMFARMCEIADQYDAYVEIDKSGDNVAALSFTFYGMSK